MRTATGVTAHLHVVFAILSSHCGIDCLRTLLDPVLLSILLPLACRLQCFLLEDSRIGLHAFGFQEFAGENLCVWTDVWHWFAFYASLAEQLAAPEFETPDAY